MCAAEAWTLGGGGNLAGRGIPFVGEDGFYPNWTKGSARWVFQRTLTTISGLYEAVAESETFFVPESDKIIVWVPGRRGIVTWFATESLHRERELALGQLARLRLRCYGKRCGIAPKSLAAAKAVVHESGVHPEDWRLSCPQCGGRVGPDLGCIGREPIIARWNSVGRPELENPAAGATFSSVGTIPDLPEWIQKNDPSHLELAYVGQQMWTEISVMLDELASAA